MKKALLFLVLIANFIGFSQTITDTISSEKLDEKRTIQISLPKKYDKNNKKGYPILVVLDGDYLFEPFVGAIKYANYWQDLPEMIVVGVHQNVKDERYEDCKTDSETGLPTGKGSKFFEFIGGELMNYMQTKYSCNQLKIIAGHDVTAGFANLYLYKSPPIFSAYISLNPEMPNDMEANLYERLSAIKQSIFFFHSLSEGDTSEMKLVNKKLDENLKSIKNESLNYKFLEQKGSHYSSVLSAIPDALYSLFEGYQPITTTEYEEKIVKLPSGYVDYLIKKYDKLDKSLGYKISVKYSDFKAIEAAILKNKAYNELEQLAVEANKNYPKAMLGEYLMAQYYERKEDQKRAVKSYLSAYQMEPIGDLTKEMMVDRAEDLKMKLKKEAKKGAATPAPEVPPTTETTSPDVPSTTGTEPVTITPEVPVIETPVQEAKPTKKTKKSTKKK